MYGQLGPLKQDPRARKESVCVSIRHLVVHIQNRIRSVGIARANAEIAVESAKGKEREIRYPSK